MLSELDYLNLSSNSLTGTLPVEWVQPMAFPQLQYLWLQNNSLSGESGLLAALQEVCLCCLADHDHRSQCCLVFSTVYIVNVPAMPAQAFKFSFCSQ